MDTKPDQALPWKVRAIRSLGQEGAPRVFDPVELEAWLNAQLGELPRRTVRRALSEWEASGIVRRAARGLYLNLQAFPEPALEEVASRMRPGAVVSLSTVLGRAGVLNNPTHWVTAIVPSDSPSRPVNQIASDDGSMFVFALMKPELMAGPQDDWSADALEPYAAAPTATPEKALLDWLYVGGRGRGVERWAMPASHDWDVSYLDADRLSRLAERMNLSEELEHFLGGLESGPKIKPKRFTR